jgi:hypothetical protein
MVLPYKQEEKYMTDIHLNSHDAGQVRKTINEMSNCLLRIDSEKEAMKEMAEDIQKKFGIRKTILNKVAHAHHKHKYAEMQMANDHFQYVYESLMGNQDEE